MSSDIIHPSVAVPVRRRQVFYLPGYDPFPPRRYRELYRREAAEQAAISGYSIALQAREDSRGFGWRVVAEIDAIRTETDVDVLVWSDIVRASRPASILVTYIDALRTAWIYLSTGALFRLVRLRKGPVVAALYPVVVLLVQAQLAALAGWAVWRGAGAILPGGWGAVGVPAAFAAAYAVLRAFKRADGRIFAYYLMHDFAYAAAGRGAYAPDLEARIEVFAGQIASALEGDVDEVLVVGHSSGAHLAVSAVARARTARTQGARPALSLLTLGHVVPMMTFLPKATRLRGDLKALSQTADVTWLDVSAPGDGCCFALCDPVAVSGQGEGARWPVVISARFTATLSAARRRALRWRFFRIHFQYLCAFDDPRGYDYFRITAGPKTLAEQVTGRKQSPSRRTRPQTAFTQAEST
jgi:hypothetical protein